MERRVWLPVTPALPAMAVLGKFPRSVGRMMSIYPDSTLCAAPGKEGAVTETLAAPFHAVGQQLLLEASSAQHLSVEVPRSLFL